MMVSFLAGLCDLCGETDSLATPEQCKAAGIDLDASVCVRCLERANPAAGSLAKEPETTPRKPS